MRWWYIHADLSVLKQFVEEAHQPQLIKKALPEMAADAAGDLVDDVFGIFD